MSRSSLAPQVSGYLVACGCVVPVGEGLGHLFVDVPRLATGGGVRGAPAELRAVLFSYALSTVAFALLAPVSNLSLHAAGVSGWRDLPDLRLRSVGRGGGAAHPAGVVGPDGPEPAHAAGVGSGGVDRGRGDVAGI